MEFFEFFFSGPGWIWKVFTLAIIINILVHGIALIVRAVFDGKSRVIQTQIKDMMNNLNKNSPPTTKDDVET